MATKKQTNTMSRRAANTFGIIGYFFCILQWLWVAVLYVPALFKNDIFRTFVLPQQDKAIHYTPVVEANGPPLLMSIIAIIITIVVTLFAVYVLIKLPLGIAKSGHKVAEKTAKTSLPLIVHHKKLPKKKQLQLTAEIIAGLKFGAVFVALMALIGVYFIPIDLPKNIFVIAGLILAAISTVSFTTQYLIARWRNVQLEQLL